MQNLLLAVFYLFVLFPFPAGNNSSVNFQSKYPDSSLTDLNHIKESIRNSGLTDELASAYSFFLLNTPVSPSDENIFIQSIDSQFYRTYFSAVLLKRDGRYDEIYSSLIPYISSAKAFYPFYDLLLFSASVTGSTQLLIKSVEKKLDTDTSYYYYLLAALNESAGSYNIALEQINNLIAEDSSSFRTFLLQSKIFRGLGDYNSAMNSLSKCYQLIGSDSVYRAEIDIAGGSLHFLSGNYEMAESLYKKGFSLAEKYNDLINRSRALINLAIINDITGNVDEARRMFREVISVAGSAGDPELLAIAHSELGVSFTFTGHLAEARENYLVAHDLFRKLNNRSRLSYLSENLGKIFVAMNDYTGALKHFRQGLEYASENKRAAALNLVGIADVYANLSDYSKALMYYRKAEELSSLIDEIAVLSEVKYGLGSLNFNLDRYNDASDYYKEALKSAESAGNEFLLADIYHKLGLSMLYADSINLAEKYFNNSIGISEKLSDNYNLTLALIDLAALKIKTEEFGEASGILNRARKYVAGNSADYLNAQISLYEAEMFDALGNFNAANRKFSEALRNTESSGHKHLMIAVNHRTGEFFEKNNLGEAALSYYLKAVSLVDEVSRMLFTDEEVQISYFAGKKNVYDSLINYYLKNSLYKEAFLAIENSRSRNTMQNLKNLKLYSMLRDSSAVEKLYEYEWIIASGIYPQEVVDSVTVLLSLLKENIVVSEPLLKRYLGHEGFPGIESVQKNLADDEYLLSYYTDNRSTFLFLLSHKMFRVIPVDISSDSIASLLSSISPQYERKFSASATFINHDLFAFNAAASAKAYDILFRPAAELIPNGSKVIICPSAPLLTLPFEMLVADLDTGSSAFRYDDKNFLVTNYSISYSPSAALFLEQKKNRRANNNRILLVGDPEIVSSGNVFAERRGLLEESTGVPRNIALLPLKYSLEEVSEIGSIISADRILTKNNATETNFKQNAELNKVIHLSTHSFLYNKQPVIFFSNENDELNDGFLEIAEIVKLKLNSDLVVLSSCNSGLGMIDEAEGIIGMSKAFFEAGAKSVVVSLWDVNDRYTSAFMKLFYRHLSSGLDKSDALAKAKSDFIKNYSANPYYWGAFVLTGSIEPVSLRAASGPGKIPGLLMIVIFISVIISLIRKRSFNS